MYSQLYIPQIANEKKEFKIGRNAGYKTAHLGRLKQTDFPGKSEDYIKGYNSGYERNILHLGAEKIEFNRRIYVEQYTRKNTVQRLFSTSACSLSKRLDSSQGFTQGKAALIPEQTISNLENLAFSAIHQVILTAKNPSAAAVNLSTTNQKLKNYLSKFNYQDQPLSFTRLKKLTAETLQQAFSNYNQPWQINKHNQPPISALSTLATANLSNTLESIDNDNNHSLANPLPQFIPNLEVINHQEFNAPNLTVLELETFLFNPEPLQTSYTRDEIVAIQEEVTNLTTRHSTAIQQQTLPINSVKRRAYSATFFSSSLELQTEERASEFKKSRVFIS